MSGPRAAALAFLVLAAAVLAVAAGFPPGSQGVPGPALVPRVLGVALAVVALLIVRTPGQSMPRPVRHHAAVPATMLLLVGYALLWRVVPFGVLTGVVLMIFLRLTGVRLQGAVVAAVLMAAALHTLFVQGLGVRF